MSTAKHIWFCLASIAVVAGLCQATQEAISASDCLIILQTTTPTEGRPGTGFAIGDGTLVVTAYHVVAEKSAEGNHRMIGVVKALSPHLGQCCYAEVVGVNKQQDLVVLKVPWRGHPAFALVDDEALLAATDLETVGMFPLLSAIPAESKRPFPPAFFIERDTIEVDFVAVRQRIPQFISLAGRGQLGPGWSGAPMILPGTLEAAGCFVQLSKSLSDGQLTCQGPALAQARSLIADAGHADSLTMVVPRLAEKPDGYPVARLFLEAQKALIRDEYEEANTKTEELVRRRPKTAVFRILAAQLQEAQEHDPEAEAHYRKALELEPQTPMIGMLYGQFLLERDPDKGLAALEGLWEHSHLRPWLILLMWNRVQRSETIDERYVQMLREALIVEPSNAYLWFNLGAAQLQRGQNDEGFEAMARGVDLFPERSSLRGHLARLLENVGRLDEAQSHFRRLLEIEPQNPVVFYWFARFLARHRPEAGAMALDVAQRALALPPRQGLPREEIEQLIERIQHNSPDASDAAALSPVAP